MHAAGVQFDIEIDALEKRRAFVNESREVWFEFGTKRLEEKRACSSSTRDRTQALVRFPVQAAAVQFDVEIDAFKREGIR